MTVIYSDVEWPHIKEVNTFWICLARWQSGYAADCKSVNLGSTPGRASIFLRHYATLAQLVERNLAKVEVTSSSLVCRSKFLMLVFQHVKEQCALVVKLVDTRDLKSLGFRAVPVQVRPGAPLKIQF